MEYTTLENAKKYFWIENDKQDENLSEMIKKVTKLFDKHLWFNLWAKTYWEYLGRVEWDYVLFPSKCPINSVIEVRVGDQEIGVKRFVEDIVYLNTEVFWDVFIEYRAGYVYLDDIKDIEEACLKVIKQFLEDDSFLKSEKIEDLSNSYEKLEDPFDYKNILDKYRCLSPKWI